MTLHVRKKCFLAAHTQVMALRQVMVRGCPILKRTVGDAGVMCSTAVSRDKTAKFLCKANRKLILFPFPLCNWFLFLNWGLLLTIRECSNNLK